VLRRGQQHDAARLAHTKRRLDVPREEQPLNGQEVRLMQADQLIDQ
jgi:hypothetical protein